MSKLINWIIGGIVVVLLVGGVLGYRAATGMTSGLNDINAHLTTMDNDQKAAQTKIDQRLTALENAPAPTPQPATDLSGINSQLKTIGDDVTALKMANISDMWFDPRPAINGRVFTSGQTISATVMLPGAYSGFEKLTTWRLPDNSYITGQNVSFTAPTVEMTKTFVVDVTAQVKGQTNRGKFQFNVVPAPKPVVASAAGATTVNTPTLTVNTNTQVGQYISQHFNVNPATYAISDTNGVFAIDGVPAQVDGANVLKAQVVKFGTAQKAGEFHNQFGAGTEIMFGDPGVLLVGPDFPKAQIDASAGTAQYIAPANQQVVMIDESGASLPEGAFNQTWFGGGQVFIETAQGRISVYLQPAKGRVFSLNVRGNFGDGPKVRDTDSNSTIFFQNVAEGHVLTEQYPAGAFIDDVHVLKDEVALSHSGGTNCGRGGCSETYIVSIDTNTGAVTIAKHTADDKPENLQAVMSNIR